MTEPASHARRFIRSAWMLLGFQLFAAVAAAGVTGWAAFYVADLRAERDALRDEIAALTGEPGAGRYADEEVMDQVFGDGTDEQEPEQPAAPRTETPVPPAETTTRPSGTSANAAVPASTAAPADTAEQTRPNSTYPGGLPGQTSNSGPRPVSGRPIRPESPSTPTATPAPDIGSLIDRLDPQRDPVPCNPNSSAAGGPCR